MSEKELLERVDRFQEITGLNDGEFEALLYGGELSWVLEAKDDEPFFKESNLKKEEYVEEVFDNAIKAITDERTIDLFRELEEKVNFTPHQTSKMIAGISDKIITALEVMADALVIKDLEEIQKVSGVTTDEIVNEFVESIGGNDLYEETEVISILVSRLYDKYVSPPKEEKKDDVPAEVKKSPMSFRDRINARGDIER